MEQTLLLNATYEPLKVVHWQKAVTLWCQGKVEVISSYDREVRSPVLQLQAPVGHSACCATSRIKRNIDYVPFSRANIYAQRTSHSCQYCGEVFPRPI
jgi:5-methylcytosine-specific restriction endonuclease McrA